MAKSKITVKEAKLIKGIAEGKTKRKAALDAYHSSSPESASVTASKALKKVNVQEALQEAFRKHGIDIDSAVAPIGKALNSTIKKQEKIGEIITPNGDGTSSVDYMYKETEEENLPLRLQGSDRALRLMGLNNQEGGTTNFNFINIARDDKAKFF